MSNLINYEVMYEKANYIQPYLYYYLNFGICPNRIDIDGIDKNKLYHLLVERYSLSDNKIIKSQLYLHDKKEMQYDYVLFDLGNYCYVFFNRSWGCYFEDKLVEIIYSSLADQELVKEMQELVLSCHNETPRRKQRGI